eukprot:gene15418-biopygen17269
MASTKPVLSGRLANMGFMKKAAGKAAAAAADKQAHHDSRQAPAGEYTEAAQQQQEHHTQQQHHHHRQQQQQRQQEQQQQQVVEQSHIVHEAVDAPQQQQQQQQQQIHSKQKYSLSSRLTNMKFMQRGQQVKRGFDEAIGQDDSAKQEAEWVVASSSSSSGKGCVVIQERDPLPIGILGRMSFGKFNPAIEQLQEDAEAAASGKPLASQQQQQQQQAEGVSVTDDDMAKGWGKHAGVLKSLRMERTAKKPRRH